MDIHFIFGYPKSAKKVDTESILFNGYPKYAKKLTQSQVGSTTIYIF